ncbi:MAG: hypothetical protein ACREPP_10750, partial [Rhodanobacteraceae bacterium]
MVLIFRMRGACRQGIALASEVVGRPILFLQKSAEAWLVLPAQDVQIAVVWKTSARSTLRRLSSAKK